MFGKSMKAAMTSIVKSTSTCSAALRVAVVAVTVLAVDTRLEAEQTMVFPGEQWERVPPNHRALMQRNSTKPSVGSSATCRTTESNGWLSFATDG